MLPLRARVIARMASWTVTVSFATGRRAPLRMMSRVRRSTRPRLPAGWYFREVVAGQAARLEEDHGERVPEGEGRRRARRRRQLERAGLAPDPVEEPVVGPRARSDFGLDVKATILSPKRLRTGTSRRISSDWPLLLRRNARSPS
jgi:hypothetical protein